MSKGHRNTPWMNPTDQRALWAATHLFLARFTETTRHRARSVKGTHSTQDSLVSFLSYHRHRTRQRASPCDEDPGATFHFHV